MTPALSQPFVAVPIENSYRGVSIHLQPWCYLIIAVCCHSKSFSDSFER